MAEVINTLNLIIKEICMRNRIKLSAHIIYRVVPSQMQILGWLYAALHMAPNSSHFE